MSNDVTTQVECPDCKISTFIKYETKTLTDGTKKYTCEGPYVLSPEGNLRKHPIFKKKRVISVEGENEKAVRAEFCRLLKASLEGRLAELG